MDTIPTADGAQKPAPKWVRTLRALRSRPNLHRFIAESDPAIRDHTLPSTVAELERKGLAIARRLVKVPGFGGATALVAEYSLEPSQWPRADELLERAAHAGPG